MRYRVICADRRTGQRVELVLEARDEVAAEALANRHGVLVSDVLSSPQIPPDEITLWPARRGTVGVPASREVQIIEQTAKRWKAIQLLGALMLLTFPLICVAQWVAWIVVAGIAVYIYGRVMAWWHHG